MLTTWTKEHPGSILDGVKKLYWRNARQQLRKRLFQPIFITYNQETVQINRFQIDKRFYGWILKRIDGSCMFVKLRTCNSQMIRYQVWLGGDLGFTSEIIARKQKSLLPEGDLDMTTTNQDDTDSSDSDGKLFDNPKSPGCFRISRVKWLTAITL